MRLRAPCLRRACGHIGPSLPRPTRARAGERAGSPFGLPAELAKKTEVFSYVIYIRGHKRMFYLLL